MIILSIDKSEDGQYNSTLILHGQLLINFHFEKNLYIGSVLNDDLSEAGVDFSEGISFMF